MCVYPVLHPFSEDVFCSICEAGNHCNQGEVMVDITCLLTLNVVVPLLEVVKALLDFAQSPSMYACNFRRVLNYCIQDVHDLYCFKNALNYDAFSCFVRICELT